MKKAFLPLILMTAVIVLIFTTLIFLWAGFTSPTRTVDDLDIVNFNRELVSEFNEVETVKTYIRRPTMYWDIYIGDSSDMDVVFYYIVEFIKSNNLYENKIKDNYTGKVWASRINITFYKRKFIKKSVFRLYEGCYYKTEAGHTNEIDNFNRWSIYEGRSRSGARHKIGTYEYQNN
jgi:hypothetical protein